MDEKPLKVLFIEDNPADVRLIEELLGEATSVRIDLEHAEALAAGIQRLETGEPDALLLDLNLRASRGLDTLAAVQSASATVPIVVLTGLGDEQLARDAVRRGAQDYLVKGKVDRDSLVQSLVYACERYRAEQSLRESEARFRLLTRQVPAILWTTDRQLRFTSSLGRGLEALKLKQGQVNGQSLFEFFQTRDEAFAPIALHRKALEGEEASGVVPWADRWYQTHVEPLRNAEGRIIGTVGVALDVSEQHRMEEDIKAAQRIQQHLLPKGPPRCPGFDIAGACFPAEHCSGDYFDFIPLRGGHLAIVVADVVGHGFAPAILAATVRSYLRAAVMRQTEIHEMLTMVNWLLAADSEPDQYVTMFCCRLDPHRRTFKYAAAGHQAYLIDSGGKARFLETGCMPLGIRSEETFHLSRNVALRAGDILLFVTDGILETESAQGELFRLDRTLDVLNRHRAEPAEAMIQCLYQAARAFAHPRRLEDDVTAVLVKVEPDPSDANRAPTGRARQAEDEDAEASGM